MGTKNYSESRERVRNAPKNSLQYFGSRILAWVVWKVDDTIHRINHYPLDSIVCFVNTSIQWITIYLVYSVIQPSNKQCQGFLKS